MKFYHAGSNECCNVLHLNHIQLREGEGAWRTDTLAISNIGIKNNFQEGESSTLPNKVPTPA